MPGSDTALGASNAAAAFDPVPVAAIDEQKSLVNAGECNLYGFDVVNNDAALRHLHFFDAAAIADVTLGTTAPDLVLPLLSSANKVLLSDTPLKHFSLGIVVVVKTVATTAGTTGPTVDASGTFFKK